jgi:hypothetical protein
MLADSEHSFHWEMVPQGWTPPFQPPRSPRKNSDTIVCALKISGLDWHDLTDGGNWAFSPTFHFLTCHKVDG